MANSCKPGPVNPPLGMCKIPARTPGPLGFFDHGDPNVISFIGDTPGSLGIYDWATPDRSHLHSVSHPVSAEGKDANIPGECACNRDITLAELRKIFSKQKKAVCEKFLPHINSTFKNYEINTCLRKAHFLAQVGHESGELRYTAEVLKKGTKESNVYDGYKGRGLIQITYKKNYKSYGEDIHHVFLNAHRTELEEPKWATDSAGWYWTTGSSRNLNGLADKNDLLAITALVNGAFNGFEDRRKHLEAAISVLKVSGCKTSGIGNEKFRPFKDSDIYNKMILSFAWGCWNDPNSGKSGVDKSVEQRKLGYQRFLDLYNALTPAQQHHLKSRYGFNPKKMISLATEGVQ